MENISFESGVGCSAPSGPGTEIDLFRGLHPRLFVLFVFGEWPMGDHDDLMVNSVDYLSPFSTAH